MNPVRRLIEAIAAALPLPDAMGGSRRPVDPRVDPEALAGGGGENDPQDELDRDACP